MDITQHCHMLSLTVITMLRLLCYSLMFLAFCSVLAVVLCIIDTTESRAEPGIALRRPNGRKKAKQVLTA